VDNVLAVAGERVIVVNSRPVHRDDRALGTVLTFRDRTDLDMLTRELDAVRSLTDGLRAQRHEYSNRLHTLSGLLQLDHRAEALEYLQALTETGAGRPSGIDGAVADPYLSALLLAKTEQAREKDVELAADRGLVGTRARRRPGRGDDRAGQPAGQRTAGRAAGCPAAGLGRGDPARRRGHAAPVGPGQRPRCAGGAARLGVRRGRHHQAHPRARARPGPGRHEARGRGGNLWLVNGSDAGGGDTAADPEHGTEAGALFVAALPGVLSATTVTAPVGGDR